jgi:hypothetical protein
MTLNTNDMNAVSAEYLAQREEFDGTRYAKTERGIYGVFDPQYGGGKIYYGWGHHSSLIGEQWETIRPEHKIALQEAMADWEVGFVPAA